MDKAGSYWDYRDYIFSLVSNNAFRDKPIRLNVERGTEWVNEMKSAAIKYSFANCTITTQKPSSWASFMFKQITENPTTWTMPFPGDHIYIEDSADTFEKYLKIGTEKKVAAISFGHIQDWDFLLNWSRIEVVENTTEYVIIKWGHKFKYCKNYSLAKRIQKLIDIFLMMPPVPGFMIFKSEFLTKILAAVPDSKRWQDMEYADIPETWSYKVLIPKKYLYRHVHGYWLEHALEVINGKKHLGNKNALDSMYVRTNYDYKANNPTNAAYRDECFQRSKTMLAYWSQDRSNLPSQYSPFFNPSFPKKKNSLNKIHDFFILEIIDRTKYEIGKMYFILKSYTSNV